MTSSSAIEDPQAWSPAPSPSFLAWLEEIKTLDEEDADAFFPLEADLEVLTHYLTTTQSPEDAARRILEVESNDEAQIEMLIDVMGGVPSVHGRLCALINAVRAMDSTPSTTENPHRWWRLMREWRGRRDGRWCTDMWRNFEAFAASYSVLCDARVINSGGWRVIRVVNGEVSGPRNDNTWNLDVQAACIWIVRAGGLLHEYFSAGKDGGLVQWGQTRAYLQSKLDDAAADGEHRRTKQPRVQDATADATADLTLSTETLEAIKAALKAMDAV